MTKKERKMLPKANRNKMKRQGKKKVNFKKEAAVNVPEDYPWKILRWLTEDLSEFLSEDEYALMIQICKDRDIEAYLALDDLWGLQCIGSTETYLPAMRAKYQLSTLIKKFPFATSEVERRQNAIQKFMDAERKCEIFNRSSERKFRLGENDICLSIMTYATSFITRVIGSTLPEWDALTEWSRHGPGASLDTVGGKNSGFEKFRSWPYTCTRRAVPHAMRLIRNDPRWIGALEDNYRQVNGIKQHAILDLKKFWSSVIALEDSNRVDFVPKTCKTDRSIAIEPALNLQLQLGVDGFIRRRLKRWGIDLDDQSKNQELARLGSLLGDSGFVTLDLAAASDSISLLICRLLLPPEWYRYLCDLRSPRGELGEEQLVYSKMSSMGNGFTFALESLIFASIVYACHRHHNLPFNFEEVAIYGDDLIVKKEIADTVTQALCLSGFAINTEKSFYSGPIRESCGADWFQGFQLRPVFLTRKPVQVNELWADINRLKRKLSLHWGRGDTPSRMEKWIPRFFKSWVGPPDNEEFSSYLHGPPPKINWDWTYRFRRLLIEAVSQEQGVNRRFFDSLEEFRKHHQRIKDLNNSMWCFRKLQASLRESPTLPKRWWDVHQQVIADAAAQNLYTIVRRNAYRLRVGKSRALEWPDENHAYKEYATKA